MSTPRFLNETDELNRTIQHMEGRISDLESKLALKEIECDQVTANLAEIAEYVQELETALAEAHLMSIHSGGVII